MGSDSFFKDGNFEVVGGDPEIDHEFLANGVDVVKVVVDVVG